MYIIAIKIPTSFKIPISDIPSGIAKENKPLCSKESRQEGENIAGVESRSLVKIPLQLGSKNCVGMLDTGATYCCVRASVAQDAGVQPEIDEIELVAANRTIIKARLASWPEMFQSLFYARRLNKISTYVPNGHQTSC